MRYNDWRYKCSKNCPRLKKTTFCAHEKNEEKKHRKVKERKKITSTTIKMMLVV